MKRSVAQLLDRPGGRWLLGPLASVFVTATRRERCRARHVDGVWRHTFRDGALFDTRLTTMTPALLRRRTIDVFFHGYVPGAGDTIVDIGAGTGSELVEFARRVGPRGRVIAVEAHPETVRCLAMTARWYGLPNVQVIHAAIADRNGDVGITDEYAGRGNSVLHGRRHARTVPALTLDRLADRYALRDVALLKMNIEGAETLAIRGMTRMITGVRHVAISCHDFKARRTGDDAFRSKHVVEPFLRAHGFTLTVRPDDPRPSVADYLYGSRRDG